MCVATLKNGKLCRRKQSHGNPYCGYHLPLDPNSGLTYCSFKKGLKSCGIPVPITGDGFCKYHRPGNAAGGGSVSGSLGTGADDSDGWSSDD